MIPICRAEQKDTKDVIVGLLAAIDEEINLCSIREKESNFVGGNICILHTLEISFDNGKSFLKLSDLEVHTCIDFELKYVDIKNRVKKERQLSTGKVFTIITDKGR